MNEINRLFSLALCWVFCGSVLALNVCAETWSDSTGKFQVEAEFRGVQGKNIVLEKPDGSAIQVPIERLSEASRARAKQLYEASKANATSENAASVPASPPIAQASAIERPSTVTGLDGSKLGFSPPSAPAVPPIAEFPEDASLQGTIDHVKETLMAGHPEVLWYALPDEIRETLDSDSVRAQIAPQLNRQEAASQQMEAVTLKAINVLLSKKEFVLNSPILAQVPPDMAPMIEQAYDPGVGVIYEALSLSAAMRSLNDRSFTQIFEQHGPLIGGHLKQLIALAPPQTLNAYFDAIKVQQTDEQTGTVTMMSPNGQSNEETFVRYGGRWIPKQLADAWPEKREDRGEALSQAIEGANNQSEQYTAMIGMFAGMANSILDPMLSAKTQQDFDQAVGQIMQMAGGMGQSGLPGQIGPNDAPGEIPFDEP